jgi:hypothetical protein
VASGVGGDIGCDLVVGLGGVESFSMVLCWSG